MFPYRKLKIAVGGGGVVQNRTSIMTLDVVFWTGSLTLDSVSEML